MSGAYKKTNGCGPEKGLFRPPFHIFFNASCIKHDELYNRGGKEIDRKVADILFLHYMKMDVAAQEGMMNKLGLYIWSYIYYIAVRIGGSKFFNYC